MASSRAFATTADSVTVGGAPEVVASASPITTSPDAPLPAGVLAKNWMKTLRGRSPSRLPLTSRRTHSAITMSA
eukprot:1167647-Lingulodinium_polyedra.AAC.1